MAVRIVVVCLLGIASAYGPAAGATDLSTQRRAASLRSRHLTLVDRFVGQLDELAKTAEADGEGAAAAEIRAYAVPPQSDGIDLAPLPASKRPEVSLALPPDERNRRLRLRFLADAHADELYRLSRQLVGAGAVTSAQRLVRDCLFYNPDHKGARRLLGYVDAGSAWTTPFLNKQRTLGRVDHPTFGWLPASHVAKYEEGRRFYRGRWLRADHEAELRRDIKQGWVAETEHFRVRTNHSLEKGVEIARKLEVYHEAFLKIFVAFFRTPEQLGRLFDGSGTIRGRSPGSRDDKYDFVLFRDRKDYVANLRRRLPWLTNTNGAYIPGERKSYFYSRDAADGGDPIETVYHEATHQLMYESIARDRPIGERAHFWATEGIACYMESFRVRDGAVSLGHVAHPRFLAARVRRERDGFYKPLATFAAIGQSQLQQSPEVQAIYSQASGLAHFFMHYDGGRYRDAFVAHLAEIYRGDPVRPVTDMSRLTGVSYETLDRQYLEYVSTLGGVQNVRDLIDVPAAKADEGRRAPVGVTSGGTVTATVPRAERRGR